MQSYVAGQILIIDWRDAVPNEPSKLRPGIVIEDTDLFESVYQNVIVVPLAQHADFAIESLTVTIEPDAENGCKSTCYALSHNVTTTSKKRIMRITDSRISEEQVTTIRRQIAESIGL